MSSDHKIKMWTPNTVGLVLFMLIGGAVALYRMKNGLGAATNLNDVFPWGLWLGFDVLGGVAMAGGGFIIAAAIYSTGRNTSPSAGPLSLPPFSAI